MSDDELVRRLLAEARHDEPMPPDVAERLDATLAGLVAARAGEADGSSLAARRATRHAPGEVSGPTPGRASRRWRWAALGAAAAAVVAGVVVAQSLSSPSPDASTAGAADSSADGGGSLLEGASTAADPRVVDGYLRHGVRRLSSERLAADVPPLVAGLSGDKTAPGAVTGVDFPCAPAAWGPGELVPVLLDGHPAVVVVRPLADGEQRADLLACGTGALLASVPVR